MIVSLGRFGHMAADDSHLHGSRQPTVMNNERQIKEFMVPYTTRSGANESNFP